MIQTAPRSRNLVHWLDPQLQQQAQLRTRQARGLANLLATLNLPAFTLHSVLDRVCDSCRLYRDTAGTRRRCCEKLRVLMEMFWFGDWTALLQTMLGRRLAVPP
ncbi:MAG: hypothetical protein OXN97_05205 [Bryobacterales bacterium]|nr:hypothetical protein [Bryobacterales bacterium]MDE0627441.1 hypothetical protein [Bryobacterales bacterium]